MKIAKYWQDNLNGETSIESIQAIQADALTHAIRVMADHAATYPSQGIVRGFSAAVIDDLAKEMTLPVVRNKLG